MKNEDIIIGQKVTPFQKTAKGWESDIKTYLRYGCGKFLKENGYLYVKEYDDYEEAWVLRDESDDDSGDYFNAEDFEPISEDKQELFNRFLNASFELNKELINKLSQDGTYLTDKEQEFTLALSEWHNNI
jgi:hypothetical protein